MTSRLIELLNEHGIDHSLVEGTDPEIARQMNARVRSFAERFGDLNPTQPTKGCYDHLNKMKEDLAYLIEHVDCFKPGMLEHLEQFQQTIDKLITLAKIEVMN